MVNSGLQIWKADAYSYHGAMFKPGCILISKNTMSRLKFILCDSTEKPLFVGKKLKVTYSWHYFGYKIDEEIGWNFMKISDLIYDKKALYPVRNGLGQEFVIPKYFISYSEFTQ